MDERTEARDDGLGAALDSLFSDPAARERFENMVKTFRENMDRAPDDASPKTTPENFPTGSAQSPPASDGLASILSNPALMADLPNLLAGMRSAPLPPAPREKGPDDRRRDLLLALKPFLSKERGDAIEMILQISRLGNVLRMMR